MRASPTIAMLLGIGLLYSQLGCSFVFARSPPNEEPSPIFVQDCSDSFRAPVTDTVVAAGAPLWFLAMVAGPGQGTGGTASDSERNRTFAVMGISALAVSGVFLASAIYGYHTVRQCRQFLATPPKRALPPPPAEIRLR